jgi:hypothetical protein
MMFEMILIVRGIIAGVNSPMTKWLDDKIFSSDLANG